MSELLDDLARTLAQPMPRRRALGVLGVTLVGLATGGSATCARGPLGGRQSSGCGSAYKVCSPATENCFAHCCPKHTVCSPGPVSSRGCQINPGCCDPCNPRASQPDGNGGCAPGPVAADCCKGPICGADKKCCPRPNRCVAGRCCPAIRTTFAPGTRKRGVACCPPGTIAVKGGIGLCCRRGDPDCCDKYDTRIGDDENLPPLPLQRGRLCVNGRIRRT